MACVGLSYLGLYKHEGFPVFHRRLHVVNISPWVQLVAVIVAMLLVGVQNLRHGTGCSVLEANIPVFHQWDWSRYLQCVNRDWETIVDVEAEWKLVRAGFCAMNRRSYGVFEPDKDCVD